MAVEFAVWRGDVTQFECDILVTKFANGHHGADFAVASALGRGNLAVESGKTQFYPGNGKIGAKEVLVLGVGRLNEFQYREIRKFAELALEKIAWQRPNAEHIGLTIHGPGYGLDELLAIDSLVKGIKRGAQSFTHRNIKVSFVERKERVALLLEAYLSEGQTDARESKQGELAKTFISSNAEKINDKGPESNRLFAAMPFSPKFDDHWDFALQPAAHENGYAIERLDKESFVGDIMQEVRKRIAQCAAVVAVLDGRNPNVFLEVGYAWGLNKPTVLIMESDSDIPFDVRGHRILHYPNLGTLRPVLSAEIRGLTGLGHI